MIAKLRKIIHEADPGITEKWKRNTAVWSHDRLVVAAGALKGNVKMNFFPSRRSHRPAQTLHCGLEAKKTRAIDFHEDDNINEPASKDLIRATVAQNRAGQKK